MYDKITIQVEPFTDLADALVRETIMGDLKILNKYPTKANVSIFHALQEALSYYSNKEDLAKFEADFMVDPAWAQYDLEDKKAKAQKELDTSLDMIQSMFPGVKGVGFVV